jgi:hypothetical protein
VKGRPSPHDPRSPDSAGVHAAADADGRADVRDAMPPSHDPIPNTGRRAAPRLRLTVPARLVTVTRTHDCILIDISSSGAQVILPEPLAVLEAAQLQCGMLDEFVIVNRERYRLNGLEFDEKLPRERILALRAAFDAMDRKDREATAAAARNLIYGITGS